jgi:hypothetical protein
MDSETIIYLLKGGHLSMQERQEMRIWPHPPLLLGDLVDELIEYFETHRWFPHEWVERKDGETIDDVTVIEKTNDRKFVYRSRSADPHDMTKIAAKTEKIFDFATEVSYYYLRTALHLPGRLDKWLVVDEEPIEE